MKIQKGEGVIEMIDNGDRKLDGLDYKATDSLHKSYLNAVFIFKSLLFPL